MTDVFRFFTMLRMTKMAIIKHWPDAWGQCGVLMELFFKTFLESVSATTGPVCNIVCNNNTKHELCHKGLVLSGQMV